MIQTRSSWNSLGLESLSNPCTESAGSFSQNVAPYLPAYHTAQLAWTTLGAGDESPLSVHLLWLAGYTVLFLALGLIAYRRDEGKTYG